MTAKSLLALLRGVLDPELGALGFRRRRMWKSSDGWYVRRWAEGTERVGFGMVTRHPEYVVSAFVTTGLDRVAELVCPCLGYRDPDAADDFFDHDFNLSPFLEGPPGDTYREHVVTTEDEARRAAQEIAQVVRDLVDPWFVRHRSPTAMFALVSSPWRSAGPIRDPLRGMVEIALAYLTSSPDEARLRAEALTRTEGWPPLEREKLERLIAAIDQRRSTDV